MDSKKLYEKMKYENTSNVVSYVLNNIEIGTDTEILREHIFNAYDMCFVDEFTRDAILQYISKWQEKLPCIYRAIEQINTRRQQLVEQEYTDCAILNEIK